MRYLARIVTIVGLLAGLTPAALRAQTKASPHAGATTPREGVLLLKNGQLLAGRITWSGDHYFVDRNGLQMGVRSAEVELTARDLDDAYQQKRAKLAKDDWDGCQNLAQWCLRHDLLGYAATELAECEAIQPRHPRTQLLMRQLQSAVRVSNSGHASAHDAPTKSTSGESTAPAGQPVADADDAKLSSKVDAKADSPESKLMAALSSDTLETFVTTIQPMLINNCATGGCHGGASNAELKFHRFDPRKSPSRVYTERNLAAVLKHIDRDNPANSRLLVAPSQPHGRAKTAVFAGKSLDQRAELAAWIHRVAGRQNAHVAAQSNPAHKSRRGPSAADRSVKPAGFNDPSAGKANRTDAAPGEETLGDEALGNESLGSQAPSNPHDPSVFNRRYFPKGPRSNQGDRDDDPIEDTTLDDPTEEPQPFDAGDEPAALPVTPERAKAPRTASQVRSPNRRSVPDHAIPGRPVPRPVPNPKGTDDDIPAFQSIEEGEIAGEQPRQ